MEAVLQLPIDKSYTVQLKILGDFGEGHSVFVIGRSRSLLALERQSEDARYCCRKCLGMPDKCEVCEIEEPHTGLILVGANGATRIAVCSGRKSKAKAHDPETWQKIREIMRRP